MSMASLASKGAKSVTEHKSGSTLVAIQSERGVIDIDATKSTINCDELKLLIRLPRMVPTLSCVAILWSRLTTPRFEHLMTLVEICTT